MDERPMTRAEIDKAGGLLDAADMTPAELAADVRAELAREAQTRAELDNEALRIGARADLADDIEEAIENSRKTFLAAAAWLALREFIMRSDGIVEIYVCERTAGTLAGDDGGEIVRDVRAVFPDAVGEEDVDNQLDQLADDLHFANAKREDENERARREAAAAFRDDDADGRAAVRRVITDAKVAERLRTDR